MTNFSYKRDLKGAIGFYIAYLVLILIAGVVLGALFGLITNQASFNFGLRIGSITAIVITIGLSLLIIRDKNLSGNFGFILIALGAGILAFFGGGILGLIPAAYLSTKRPIKK